MRGTTSSPYPTTMPTTLITPNYKAQLTIKVLDFKLQNSKLTEAFEWALGFDRSQTSFQIVRYNVMTLMDMEEKLMQYGSLSAKQIAFGERLHTEGLTKIENGQEAIQKRQELIDQGVTAPKGRMQVKGTIISTKVVDNDFGCVTKVLVDLGGVKVWGSLPSAGNGNKGASVTFVATFEPSPNDPLFGFYKRPSNWTETPVITNA